MSREKIHLDTFGYRNPYAESRLRVFEVDHPATQSWKRMRLRDAEIAIPDSLTFAPIDFDRSRVNSGALGSSRWKILDLKRRKSATSSIVRTASASVEVVAS